jgi:hypothetical protein
MVGDGRKPIEVREHLLGVPHHALEALCDVVKGQVALLVRQLLGDALDHHVARIGNRVDRVAEADDDFLGLDALADIGLGLVRIGVAGLDLVGDLVGAAVLRPTQGADAPGDGRVHVRPRAGDDAAGEGRGVELMLGVEDQAGVHGAHPAVRRRLAVQQVQEVAADAVVVGLDLDAPAVLASAASRAASSPGEAMRRSAISRAPGWLWSCASGRAQPSAETPVRMTSIGWAAAGICSRTALTLAGRPRSAFSLAL